jgi:hypothetical protein
MVYPFGISRRIGFIPQPQEVAHIIELPLSVFLDDALVVETNVHIIR